MHRRPVYLFAISIFFLTTAWCALVRNLASFIAARAAAGPGAGGVISVGFIIVSNVVKIQYRGMYQSYMNNAYGFGNAAGAALGWFLCDNLGWRAAFGVQLPCIFVYLLLASASTPTGLGPSLAPRKGKRVMEAFGSFDFSGSICLTIGVSSPVLGINLGGNIFPRTHLLIISALILFAVSTAYLILVERRAPRPIMPLPLLSTIPIATLIFSNFFSAIVTHTILFDVPLFFQAIKQTSATTPGLYLISPLTGVTVSSVLGDSPLRGHGE